MHANACKSVIAGLALGFAFAGPALAGDISISNPMAHTEGHGGHVRKLDVLMIVENTGAADRIYAARSDVAKTGHMSAGADKRTAGKHGHNEHLIATVIDVPARGRVALTQEGHHIELVDLKKKVDVGDIVRITLFFEKAGRIEIDVPVMKPHAMKMKTMETHQ